MERILYDAPPEGLTPGEVAKRCGIHRSTVWRDIRSLQNNDVPIWGEKGHYGILRERYVTSVRLNLHEATALFLATRLLSRYSDENHPHVARAMEKLAAAMPKDMMQQHIQRAADLVRRAARAARVHADAGAPDRGLGRAQARAPVAARR